MSTISIITAAFRRFKTALEEGGFDDSSRMVQLLEGYLNSSLANYKMTAKDFSALQHRVQVVDVKAVLPREEISTLEMSDESLNGQTVLFLAINGKTFARDSRACGFDIWGKVEREEQCVVLFQVYCNGADATMPLVGHVIRLPLGFDTEATTTFPVGKIMYGWESIVLGKVAVSQIAKHVLRLLGGRSGLNEWAPAVNEFMRQFVSDEPFLGLWAALPEAICRLEVNGKTINVTIPTVH